MKRLVFSLLFITLTTLPSAPATAAIPAVYTNDNFWTAPHDQPVSFSQDISGNFYGVTQTGKTFSQINIDNQFGVKLQKFSIDQAYFYISDRGVIQADTDLIALSIYLSYSV